MVKFHKKAIGAIVMLLMLASSPLTVTYSFADSEESQKPEFEKNAKSAKQAILTEKMVNGKLEVKQFALPDTITQDDMNRILSLESNGWAYVNYKSYQPGIILFDGKASKAGDNLWKISVNERAEFDGIGLELEKNDADMVYQFFSDEDLSYRIIFSGKMVESFGEIIFAIAFMNTLSYETSPNIKYLQIGQSDTNSENSMGFGQEFKK